MVPKVLVLYVMGKCLHFITVHNAIVHNGKSARVNYEPLVLEIEPLVI